MLSVDDDGRQDVSFVDKRSGAAAAVEVEAEAARVLDVDLLHGLSARRRKSQVDEKNLAVVTDPGPFFSSESADAISSKGADHLRFCKKSCSSAPLIEPGV
jgi:hypothetical protein